MGGFEVWTVDFLDKSQDDSFTNVVNFTVNQKPEKSSLIDSNFNFWSKSTQKFYEIPSSVNLAKLAEISLLSKNTKNLEESQADKIKPKF